MKKVKTTPKKTAKSAPPVVPMVPLAPAVLEPVAHPNGKPDLYPSNDWVRPKLSRKQQQFVAAYLADPELNAFRAARKVGYRGSAAGTQLLQNRAVKLEVEKQLRKRRTKFTLSAEIIDQELLAIGLSNPKDMLNPDGSLMSLQDMPDHVAVAIKDLSMTLGETPDGEGNFTTALFVKMSLHDKIAALLALRKRFDLESKLAMTSGQGDTVQKVNVPWDVVLFGEPDVSDPVEERLMAEEAKAREAKATVVHNGSNTSLQQSKSIASGRTDATGGENGNGRTKGESP